MRHCVVYVWVFYLLFLWSYSTNKVTNNKAHVMKLKYLLIWKFISLCLFFFFCLFRGSMMLETISFMLFVHCTFWIWNSGSISLPASRWMAHKKKNKPVDRHQLKDFYKLLKGWLSIMLQWFLTITVFFFCLRCDNISTGELKVSKKIVLQWNAHNINEVN